MSPFSQRALPATLAAQALHRTDPHTGAVIAPLHASTTFLRDENNQLVGAMDYRRPEGPTEQHAADILTALEGGVDARLFSSGLAAAVAVFDTVKPGATILAQTQMYYGAKKLLQRLDSDKRIHLALFDPSIDGDLAAKAREHEPELIWIETPANPGWAVVDVAGAAQIARETGAVLAVDGTCAPPCTTRALDLGADLVMHSATKYLNGHSDVLAGAVVTKAQNERWARLCDGHALTGAVPGSLESWLLIRGMRTLFVRFERQSANALALAQALQGHPKLEAVLYPGLPDHPGHAIAARQMTGGFGGLLSVVVKGGAPDAAKLAASTEVFLQATSIGGVESLIEHRKPIEGPASPTPDGLVRLSCGIEAEADLIDDVMQALERV
ncbi:MAG: PLP-dependent aspartate aminotransferase family protein [Alphaproteobacteria bacterium]|nr:PLP-dependent aspartate aminotransferase family protein [Alphaproteobacteria bacterium]